MSYIVASGYGYPKNICESVTAWFLNEFFPNHKIEIEIVNRGLKRDQVFGYCSVLGNKSRPRHFLIELDTYMDEDSYTKSLLHELSHVAQYIRGSLRYRYGKLCYQKSPVNNWEYDSQPHEIEAREEEDKLFEMYVNYKYNSAN